MFNILYMFNSFFTVILGKSCIIMKDFLMKTCVLQGNL